ncbi:odorant receptor 49b-like [Anthonomus grandis grandis]|uniref:odorant receptor 49b-like n=1 Tax=Anthonomus grandis grandis TaxID=2921223 RepID=UPI002166B4F3|nr:odorant receptor 49b-like [Anthonomus grandis grandis]
MIVIGIWKMSQAKDTSITKIYKAYSRFVQFLFSLLTFSIIMRLFQLVITGATPAKIFGCVTITLIICTMNCTVLVFIKNGIPEMFSKVMNEEAEILKCREPDVRQTYLGRVKYYNRTTTCQIMSTFFSASMFVSSNLYKLIMDAFQEHETFMYEFWFPFDEIKYKFLVVFFNLLMVSMGFFFNIASRITPQSLIIFISAELRILQIRIRRAFDNECTDEKVILVKVKQLVRKHQSIIRFVELLNDAIKNMIFLEFLINSVNVAAALLQVVTVRTNSEMAFSFFHLSLLVVQIFILSWSANDINIQSLDIANAVYESNWIDQSEEVKKIMYIMLMRAQKPLILTIGSFRVMNVESALITMKGAYTYASVMIQKYT